MKLIGSKTECHYREELIRSRQLLFEDKRNQKLLSCLESRYPDMKTAYIIGWTPEQGEDIYRVLIDASTIAGVEVDRNDDECPPVIEDISLKEYEGKLSKAGRIKLGVAIELAKSDIEAMD